MQTAHINHLGANCSQAHRLRAEASLTGTSATKYHLQDSTECLHASSYQKESDMSHQQLNKTNSKRQQPVCAAVSGGKSIPETQAL